MNMTSEQRAIDKIFKRRDRYDIPSWQREKVWSDDKKRRLIDSMLRGWRIPKFYFVKVSEDSYLVEDGQQRLEAIYDFFGNDLALSPESAKLFGGRLYKDLPRKTADAFDDFEIQYDVIEGASDEELKEFFQRLQEGMNLNSSERLNALHSKLRDFCVSASRHPFFKKTILVPNTRYAHFDIFAKAITLEIEGLDAGLRFDDIRKVFQAQASFSPSSGIAKRIKSALDLLRTAFKGKSSALRTRTIVQSLITLTCKIVSTGKSQGQEARLRKFFEAFMAELAEQIEKGQAATDSDYVTFQRSVNANVKSGARTRQQILLRKLFRIAPDLASIFDPSVIAETGVAGHIATLGDSIVDLTKQINEKHAAKTGEDLFKATNKTAAALVQIGKPVKDVQGYGALIDDLYFLFRESAGPRLSEPVPASFRDVNALRTDLRHDVDHGDPSKVRAKRRNAGVTFAIYGGAGKANTMDPGKLALVQSNLMGAIEGDLRTILLKL